jgi:predicted nucleic acid-binding protein
MPKAVSNSSPIIHLAKIGRLELLREFYGELFVPHAVIEECISEGHDRSEVSLIRRADWIHLCRVSDRNLVKLLKHDIDKGESEAIALALETNASILLLDDAEAREKARLYRIPVTGTIGILLKAKKMGKVQSLKDEIRNLTETGFWLNDNILKMLLKEAGEL